MICCRVIVQPVVCCLSVYCVGRPDSRAGEPPNVIRNVVVYGEPGRFAGWPANHGIWSWGDEILVGFSRGYDKDRGPFHHIDKEKPEEFLLARSRDGGATWSVEQPVRPAHWPARWACATGSCRRASPRSAHRPRDPIDFTHPDFAMTVRMENSEQRGLAVLLLVRPRPHLAGALPPAALRPERGDGPHRLHRQRPGRLPAVPHRVQGQRPRGPAVLRAHDRRRLTWRFLSFIGPEPTGYAIMPSTVRISPDRPGDDRPAGGRAEELDRRLRLARRRPVLVVPLHPRARHRRGQPAQPAPLPDGRLCLIYGLRARPFGICARSAATGARPGANAVVLRDDGGGRDIGYVRSILRPDGKIVAVYYYHDSRSPNATSPRRSGTRQP